MSKKTIYEGYAIDSIVFTISEYRSKEIEKVVYSPYVTIFTTIVKGLWFSVDSKTN